MKTPRRLTAEYDADEQELRCALHTCFLRPDGTCPEGDECTGEADQCDFCWQPFAPGSLHLSERYVGPQFACDVCKRLDDAEARAERGEAPAPVMPRLAARVSAQRRSAWPPRPVVPRVHGTYRRSA